MKVAPTPSFKLYLIMKKYRISPRRFRKIIQSYQAHLNFQRGLCKDSDRDAKHYFDHWIEQLKISDKLHKWIYTLGALNIIVFLCLLALTFFLG